MTRFRDIREPKPEREETRPAPNRAARRAHGNRRTVGRGRAFRRNLLVAKVHRHPELAIRRELAKLQASQARKEAAS